MMPTSSLCKLGLMCCLATVGARATNSLWTVLSFPPFCEHTHQDGQVQQSRLVPEGCKNTCDISGRLRSRRERCSGLQKLAEEALSDLKAIGEPPIYPARAEQVAVRYKAYL